MRAIPPNTQSAHAVIYVRHDTNVNTSTVKHHGHRKQSTARQQQRREHNEINRQEDDPMTESIIGYKRQAVDLDDTEDKKRAKVTNVEAVATKARKRSKPKTTVTKGKLSTGA